MNKALFAILPLVAIVAISGCVQEQATTPTGNGMVITDFSSSLDTVSGGNKTVTIYLEAENMGGDTITKATGCLIGSNMGDDYQNGLWQFSKDVEGRPVCQGLETDETLRPADLANSIPGGTLKSRWYLKSPCLAETLSRTDSFTGRVFYEYDTIASTSIWVYTETELAAANQRGESIPSSLVVESTKGPVAISIDAVQPVRAEDGTVTLKITISNVGNGVVFDKEASIGGDGTSVPSLSESDLNTFTAAFTVSGDIAEDVDCEIELTEIELRKGASVTKTCDIEIDEDKISAKNSFPITIEATYGYYIDSELSVQSSGKRNDDACEETETTE